MRVNSIRPLVIWTVIALLGGAVSVAVLTGGHGSKAGGRSEGKVLKSVKVKRTGSAGGKVATRIAEARKVGKGVPKGGFFEDELFKAPVDFSFDEEKEARLSEELKSIIRDISSSMSGFDPDRKRAYQALQRLLAKINSGEDVPGFVKLQALNAIEWLGTDAMSEAVGFLADADAQVAKKAGETLIDMLMDFDATEADLVTAILQLVKMDSLTPEQCETIMFTTSSFQKNSNKVKVALEVYDHGTDNAMSALSDNVDFIFDEAAAESIQKREDIVKYGKEHPDSKDAEVIIKFQ